MRTVKQMATMVGRAPSTVYSVILRMDLQPSNVEVLSQVSSRYWYSDTDVEKVMEYYRKLDEPEIVVKRKEKMRLFPKVIYVTRTTEIYPSKLNYLKINQL